MTNRKDRTIFDSWKITAELSNFLLRQKGLTSLDAWGGREVVRESLPEEYQANFDTIQDNLITTILKDKNRGSASALMGNLLGWVDWANERLDEGKLACYHFNGSCVEIMLALDIVPICYENVCGVTSSIYTEGAEEGVDRIEADGYPDHLCSTQKGTAGFFLMGVIPKPDILVKPATPCDPSNRMYEWTANKYNTPLIVVENPYYRNERGLKYLTGELKRMAEQLEKLTGNTLDEDKLRKYCEYSNEAMHYILKIRELRKKSPCPDTGWHRPADTSVTGQIGTPTCAEYFKRLYTDVKARADKGEGVIPEGMKERRVAYGNTWQSYDLSFFDWLEDEHGVVYIADLLTYFPSDVGFIDTTNMETMFEGLAWKHMQYPMGRQIMGFSDVWISDYMTIVKGFKVDSLILAGHMACKQFWAVNKLLSDKIREEAGIPTLRLEWDIFDKRFLPPAELRRIMNEFFTTF